ncbi:MAG: carboxypeptidase regulatory-like domain-containing protein [Rubrivivax sp.]
MHTRFQRLTKAAALAATLAAALTVLPGAAGAAPAPRTVNGITLVSGGVTIDEAVEMRQLARRYPLRLVISQPGGDYDVADRLSIWQGGRLLLELDDAGPWLLADLPPGRYALQADFGGTTLSRPLTVAAGGGVTHWVVRHP